MSSPQEGPEHRTDCLSPVSPKPLHFPAPSNIALLENQMDPNFEATASVQAEEQPAISKSHESIGEVGVDGQATIKEDVSPDNQASSLAAYNQNYGANAYNTAPESFITQGNYRPNQTLSASNEHHDAAVTLEPSPPLPTQLASTSITDTISPAPVQGNDNQESSGTACPDISAPNDSTAALSNSLNIQAFLDDIAAPNNASTAPTAATMTATTSLSADLNAPETILHPENQTARTPKDPSPSTPLTSPNLPPRPPSQNSPHDLAAQENFPQVKAEPAPEAEKPSVVDASFAPLAHAAPPPLPTAGAPGVQTTHSLPVLPPPVPIPSNPPISLFPGTGDPIQSPSMASFNQQNTVISRPGEDVSRGLDEDENLPWGPNTQKEYDSFLAAERKYVLEGNWDKFPIGSRLFLGNLPSEKVTKRDLFHVFHRYGKLAQISIKQAYGFVQYLDATQCARAMAAEQGVAIRGKAIHLEISVPGGKKQRNQRNEGRSSRNRRSRSPPGSRNGGRNSRSDNHYRPRSPDRHRSRTDDYDRRRSRSPQQFQSNYRSAQPEDSRLPLPHRAPQQVPDVQVIAKDPMERNYVQYIESCFAQRGLRADVLFLGAGLDEELVIRRQIIEGVLALIKVDRLGLAVQRFHLTIFNRAGGAANVKFDEYQNIDIRLAVELVNRAKQTARPSLVSLQGSYPPTPSAPQQQVQAPPYQYQNLPSSTTAFPAVPHPPTTPAQLPQPVNGAGTDNLQDILRTLAKQPHSLPSTAQATQPAPTNPYQQPQPQQQAESRGPDLAQILAAVQQISGGQQNSQGTSNIGNAQYSAQHGQQAQAQSGASAAVPDMSQIMAQLNRYGR